MRAALDRHVAEGHTTFHRQAADGAVGEPRWRSRLPPAVPILPMMASATSLAVTPLPSSPIDGAPASTSTSSAAGTASPSRARPRRCRCRAPCRRRHHASRCANRRRRPSCPAASRHSPGRRHARCPGAGPERKIGQRPGLADVGIQRIDLQAGDRIIDGGRARPCPSGVGVLWSAVATMDDTRQGLRPASFRPVEGCGLVTWERGGGRCR